MNIIILLFQNVLTRHYRKQNLTTIKKNEKRNYENTSTPFLHHTAHTPSPATTTMANTTVVAYHDGIFFSMPQIKKINIA
ncbi:MAG: hypothetical protein K9K75_07105 [Deltaproteobacteria bacterium]|nr:hypothetical protein [Deltaproteobacteria bacterium]